KLTGTVTAGATWTITLDGTNYSYTAVSGDTLVSVAHQLQTQIRGINPGREDVNYRQMDRVTIRTLDGNDNVYVDDTAVATVIETGLGDDNITVGTVPQILDIGNKNLEYPDGVPVADKENMTKGNSADLYIFGLDGDDTFEVNHNSAKLFLHGGDGD